MTFTHPETFRPIGQIVKTDVLPALYRAQNLPLRISCLGVASHDAGGEAERFDRVIPLGERPTPEEAMSLASLRLPRGEIRARPDSFQKFCPRIMFIHDRAQRLVLAGEIRAGIILWQQPVSSDTAARQIVTEASKLRGMAFRALDPAEADALRYRAAVLECRLVDPIWRETAADLLRLPQAA
jgi:hypothetical protein